MEAAMGLIWHSELTLDSFKEFCDETISSLYLKAYSATVDEKRADRMTVNALCRTFALRNEMKKDESAITPDKATESALKNILSNKEKLRLGNEIFSLGNDRLPPESHLNTLVGKAVAQAEVEMPRYAPVFSGVRGTLYVLAIVLCIIVCVILVWTGKISDIVKDENANGSVVYGVSAERASAQLLAETVCTVEENDKGSSVVKFVVSGADAGQVTDVNVYDASGTEVMLYDCNGVFDCFVARGGTYKLIMNDANGVSVTRFVTTQQAASGSDVLPSSLVFVHDSDSYKYVKQIETEVSATDVSMSDSVQNVAEVDTPIYEQHFDALGIIDYKLVKGPEKAGKFYLSSDGGYAFTAAKGYTGIDSVTIHMTAADDSEIEITVPIIVVNSAPTYSGALSQSVVHTPGKPGKYIGRLAGSDVDPGDVQKLTYSLIGEEGCKVILAKNGGYVVNFNDNVADAQTASFTFDVSDGLLSSRYTIIFNLKNGLIDAAPMTRQIYCYSGEEGFYDLQLPAVDSDGDKLYWSVSGEVAGKTVNGTTYRNNSNDSALFVQVDPQKNESFSEILDLVCSDGWKKMHVQYELVIKPNPDPVFKTTSVVADVATNLATCTIDWECACEFNNYRIIDAQATAGSVVKDGGWEDMSFKFIPDGTGSPASAVLTIEEVTTGKTYTHTIRVIQEY